MTTTSFLLTFLIFAGSMMWIDVPFVRQEQYGCGAASISMVMQYWNAKGHNVDHKSMDEDRIMQLLYSKEARGIKAQDLTRYLEQYGFKVFAFSGTFNDLEHHIQRGRPLITALEGKGSGSDLHYLVVAGIDALQEVILVNDPAERKMLKMTKVNFENRWRATKNWTLLAVPE